MGAKHEEIAVPEQLIPYAGAAVVRLTYLYPEVAFSNRDQTLRADFDAAFDPLELKKAMAHQLYREKIYQETLDMRRRMARALF